MSEIEVSAEAGEKEASCDENGRDEKVKVNDICEKDDVTVLKTASENKGDEKKKEQKKSGEDYKEKFYYLAAELENTKRRFMREKENLLKFGNEKILSSLIDVVDNLERTTEALLGEKDKKIKNIVSGISMVQKQFLEVLQQEGLSPIESLGKKFDPNFHEALSQQAAVDKEDDEIILEYQKGYLLNGRLLRASKVVVVKNE